MDGIMSAKDFDILRQQMLVEISAGTFHVSNVLGKTTLDERVLTAMGKVPRHEFVPLELQPYAYANIPLPIGFEKTISQPFIVALMTDLLDLSENDTVLEIGTGLGYQAVILAQLARQVYSIEIIEELAREAKQRLRRQSCSNIASKHESVTVASEDALIAALKVKCERPDALINYVRRRNRRGDIRHPHGAIAAKSE